MLNNIGGKQRKSSHAWCMLVQRLAIILIVLLQAALMQKRPGLTVYMAAYFTARMQTPGARFLAPDFLHTSSKAFIQLVTEYYNGLT